MIADGHCLQLKRLTKTEVSGRRKKCWVLGFRAWCSRGISTARKCDEAFRLPIRWSAPVALECKPCSATGPRFLAIPEGQAGPSTWPNHFDPICESCVARSPTLSGEGLQQPCPNQIPPVVHKGAVNPRACIGSELFIEYFPVDPQKP